MIRMIQRMHANREYLQGLHIASVFNVIYTIFIWHTVFSKIFQLIVYIFAYGEQKSRVNQVQIFGSSNTTVS